MNCSYTISFFISQGYSSARSDKILFFSQSTRTSVVDSPLNCYLCHYIVVMVLSFLYQAYEPLELMLCRKVMF